MGKWKATCTKINSPNTHKIIFKYIDLKHLTRNIEYATNQINDWLSSTQSHSTRKKNPSFSKKKKKSCLIKRTPHVSGAAGEGSNGRVCPPQLDFVKRLYIHVKKYLCYHLILSKYIYNTLICKILSYLNLGPLKKEKRNKYNFVSLYINNFCLIPIILSYSLP